MTAPADRLLAAADLLDKRAGEATPGPWWTDECDPADADAAYITTVHPEVGKKQAVMLRAFGTAVEREWRGFHEMWKTEQRVRMLDHRMPGLVEALAIADLLLAGAP